MNIGNYLIAGLPIRIKSLYAETQLMCTDYQSNTPSILNICTCKQDVDFEREKSEQEDQLDGIGTQQLTDGYLETLAVYRKIAERLPEYDGFVFHGSAIAVDGQGYVFTAPSGTGKSTHTRLWRELMGDRAVMVNDDKPIIRFLNGAPYVFGTPWNGKHHLSANIAVPLKAVCILERAAENSIREIAKQDALPMVIQQAYRPSDPVALAKTLALIDRMQVKYYQLACSMDIAAAQLSYETMAH